MSTAQKVLATLLGAGAGGENVPQPHSWATALGGALWLLSRTWWGRGSARLEDPLPWLGFSSFPISPQSLTPVPWDQLANKPLTQKSCFRVTAVWGTRSITRSFWGAALLLGSLMEAVLDY